MPAPKGNKFALGNRGGTGRPTKYRGLWHCKKVYQLFHLPQMTTAKCAEILDISETTLFEWFDKYEEFYEAYRSAKEELDARVTVSLRESATGFTKRTEKTVFDKDSPCPHCGGLGKIGPRGKKTKCEPCEGTGRGRIVRIPTRTYFPPDTAAIRFWLMNRQGWKTTKAMEWDGSVNLNENDSIDIDALSPETREMILRDIERASGNTGMISGKRDGNAGERSERSERDTNNDDNDKTAQRKAEATKKRNKRGV